MDPISGILGGGLGLVGAFMGAGETRRAADMNWQINLLNYYQRERERTAAINMADQQLRESHLGSTDASGNRIHFVPGRGWVTELSPEGQTIQDAQNREQMRVLNVDRPRVRAQQDVNERNQRMEDYVARGFLDRLMRTGKEDPRLIEADMNNASRAGINEAFDQTAGDALKTALRTGASNTGSIVAAIGRERSDALSKAMLDARLKSSDIAEQRYSQRTGELANLYNMFATRASKLPEVSYAPQNISGASNSLLSQFAQEAGVSGRKAIDVAGAKGGTIDYVKPDMGLANAFASAGGVVGGIGRNMAAQNGFDDVLGSYDYGSGRFRKNNGAYS